jgi:type VI secretion system protein ImpJ
VQDLHHQIATRVEQLSVMVINRGVSLQTEVPGDAERVLKLSVLNAAFTYLKSAAVVRGLPPLLLYLELCRIAGQLAIFTPARRPIDLPTYDHEALGVCFQAVIEYIQLELDSVSVPTFEKRYFERAGERLQASLEPSWISGNRGLYLAVETELKDSECQMLLSKLDMKIGSGAQVEIYFRKRVTGLKLEPVARPPRALPAGSGLVYFQIERDPVPWRDVVDTQTLGIRLNMDQATFQGDRVLTVTVPGSNRSTNLQFTLFVV